MKIRQQKGSGQQLEYISHVCVRIAKNWIEKQNKHRNNWQFPTSKVWKWIVMSKLEEKKKKKDRKLD